MLFEKSILKETAPAAIARWMRLVAGKLEATEQSRLHATGDRADALDRAHDALLNLYFDGQARVAAVCGKTLDDAMAQVIQAFAEQQLLREGCDLGDQGMIERHTERLHRCLYSILRILQATTGTDPDTLGAAALMPSRCDPFGIVEPASQVPQAARVAASA